MPAATGYPARWLVSPPALVALTVVACTCGERPPNAPCSTSYECLSREVCVEGICRQVCNSSASCERDKVCGEGVCLPLGDGGGTDAASYDAVADAAVADAAVGDAAVSDAAAVDRRADASGVDRVDAALLAPITVIVTPGDGATGIDLNASVQLDFSRPMNTATVENGGACVRSVSGGCLAGSYLWLTAASVRFTPTASFAASTVHAVIVRSACQDQSGHAFAGQGGTDCTAPDSCTRFATNDGTAPTVVSVAPGNGATGVGLQPTVTLTFSEAMAQPSVVGRVSIGGVEVAGSWSWTSSTSTAFTPSAALDCSARVQVTFDEGARDVSGLALTDACTAITGAAFCSTFTTKSTHQECDSVLVGCQDVVTSYAGLCGHCGEPMVACNNVGVTYGVDCVGTCPTDCCFVERVEIWEDQNCHQVCS